MKLLIRINLLPFNNGQIVYVRIKSLRLKLSDVMTPNDNNNDGKLNIKITDTVVVTLSVE